MKPSPQQVIKEQKATLPGALTYKLVYNIFKLDTGRSDVKYFYDFDEKDVKGKPVMLISDHSSRNAYKFAFVGYPFAKLNPVIGFHNALTRLFYIIMKNGFILKVPFNPDVRAVRNILRVIHMGGSILLFPEGTQSVCGKALPVSKQTADLLKKAGVTVVLCSSRGAFLVNPDFADYERKGPQEYHYTIIFKPEELKELSSGEIYDRLMERFAYNDNEWNITAKNSYSEEHGLAQGLDRILYGCPVCGAEFQMKAEGETISCRACGNSVKLNRHYLFEKENEKSLVPFERMDQWHEAEKEAVLKELENPDFSFSYDAAMFKLLTDGIYKEQFAPAGEGLLTLTHEGLFFKGLKDGEAIEIHFDISDVNSFYNFKKVRGNNMYYRGQHFGFTPKDNLGKAEKMRIAVMELNRRSKGKQD